MRKTKQKTQPEYVLVITRVVDFMLMDHYVISMPCWKENDIFHAFYNYTLSIWQQTQVVATSDEKRY